MGVCTCFTAKRLFGATTSTYSFVKDKDTLFHKMIKPSSTYIYNFLSSLMISSKQYKFIMLVKLLAL